MIAIEFKELVEVSTPKGDGYIWYMMDYGPQSDTIYTIVIKATGECWQMSHKDFRIKPNVTMGVRGDYRKEAAPATGAANGHPNGQGDKVSAPPSQTPAKD